jgi:AhpD family alkylhydroperoxidase
MENRVNIERALPQTWKAMYAVEGSLSKSSLTATQKNLIRIRASQINSCAFCINMHTKEALQIGESQQRIFLISAWRETDLFTAEEKALLALTEEITLINLNGVSDSVYQQAEQFFGSETVGEMIMAVALINTWNRIAISTHLPVSH